MLPNHKLSSTNLAGPMLAPDSGDHLPLISKELGGVALNDASQGLQYQVWTLTTDGTSIFLKPDNGAQTTLFTGADVTEISLAFDQNMRPFVAFVDSGVAKFWWFNTTTQAQMFSTLPAGSTCPRCCLDDKRQRELASSDVILAYVNNMNLYYRQQRDRYGVEYLLATGNVLKLINVGMAENNRLMFVVLNKL